MLVGTKKTSSVQGYDRQCKLRSDRQRGYKIDRALDDGNINAPYVFTDCQSAVNIFTKQSNAYKNLWDLRLIWKYLKMLRDLHFDLKLEWIPRHADITGNELAHKAAKNGCSLSDINNEGIKAISEQVLFGWVEERVLKRWGEMWTRSPSGFSTRCLFRDVGQKLFFLGIRTHMPELF